jgi:hypothetical protein
MANPPVDPKLKALVDKLGKATQALSKEAAALAKSIDQADAGQLALEKAAK